MIPESPLILRLLITVRNAVTVLKSKIFRKTYFETAESKETDSQDLL